MEQEKKKEEKKVVKAPRVKSKAPVRSVLSDQTVFFRNLFLFSQIVGKGSFHGIQKVACGSFLSKFLA